MNSSTILITRKLLPALKGYSFGMFSTTTKPYTKWGRRIFGSFQLKNCYFVFLSYNRDRIKIQSGRIKIQSEGIWWTKIKGPCYLPPWTQLLSSPSQLPPPSLFVLSLLAHPKPRLGKWVGFEGLGWVGHKSFFLTGHLNLTCEVSEWKRLNTRTPVC